MQYDLLLSRTEFDKADRLVRAVLLQSGRADLKSPGLLTSDRDLLDAEGRGYLDDNPESLGVCWGDLDEHTFDIWITPSYTNSNSDNYRETILHELSHGYLGLYRHNIRFQKFLSRVVYHYSHIVQAVDHKSLIANMVHRYNSKHRDESYRKYVDRLDFQIELNETCCQTEIVQVRNRYDRITWMETHV